MTSVTDELHSNARAFGTRRSGVVELVGKVSGGLSSSVGLIGVVLSKFD